MNSGVLYQRYLPLPGCLPEKSIAPTGFPLSPRGSEKSEVFRTKKSGNGNLSSI
jgi:hypothetical protein